MFISNAIDVKAREIIRNTEADYITIKGSIFQEDITVLSLHMPQQSGISFCLFITVHGVLKARMLKWFAIPFSSGPSFVRTLHHDPPICLGWPYMAWLIVSVKKLT